MEHLEERGCVERPPTRVPRCMTGPEGDVRVTPLEGAEREQFRERFEALSIACGVSFRPTDSPHIWAFGPPSLAKVVSALRQRAGYFLLLVRAATIVVFLAALVTAPSGPFGGGQQQDPFSPLYAAFTGPFPQGTVALYHSYPTTVISVIVLSVSCTYMDAVLLWARQRELLARLPLWALTTAAVTVLGSTLLGVTIDTVLMWLFPTTSELLVVWAQVLVLLAVALPIASTCLLRRFVFWCAPDCYQLGQRVLAVRDYLYRGRGRQPAANDGPHTAAARSAYARLALAITGRGLFIVVMGLLLVVVLQTVHAANGRTTWTAGTVAVMVFFAVAISSMVVLWARAIGAHSADTALGANTVLSATAAGCACLALVPDGLLPAMGVVTIGLVGTALLLHVTRAHMDQHPEVLGESYYRALLELQGAAGAREFLDSVSRDHGRVMQLTAQ